jgi:hypothetical protein
VSYELHAEPDGAPRGYAQSYEKDKGETTRLLQHVSRIPEGSSGQDENVQIEDVGDTDEFDA